MLEGGRLGRGYRAGGKGLWSWGIAKSCELQRQRSRADFDLEGSVSNFESCVIVGWASLDLYISNQGLLDHWTRNGDWLVRET